MRAAVVYALTLIANFAPRPSINVLLANRGIVRPLMLFTLQAHVYLVRYKTVLTALTLLNAIW